MNEAQEINTRFARNTLITLLFFGTIINYVDRQVLSLLKPTLEKTFGWGDVEFAHFASTSLIAAATSFLFVGLLLDRFGVRIIYALAVGIWSLAGMAHAAAATVGQFVFARIVLVGAESVTTPAGVKSVATYLPIKERSLALGIGNAGPNIGNIIAPLTVVPLAFYLGWQWAFIITGALGFVWIAFWLWGTRGLKPVSHFASADKPESVPIGVVLKDRKTWAIAGAKVLSDMFWWFFTFWLPDLFNKVFHLSQEELRWPTALAFTLAACGALTSGMLFPALLARGRTINAARKTSMLIYALLVVPVPLALLAGNAWIAALIIGLGLFAHQGFSTNIFGLTADAIPASRAATTIAFGAFCGNLAGAGIQEVKGLLSANGIGYAPLFYAASIAYLLAWLWVHLLIPEIKAAQED